MKYTIVVFGTPTCSWCKKVKDYLSSKGYMYKDIDVSKNSAGLRDMIGKTGLQSVPQIWINNQPVVGFDRAKIDRLLQAK
ncbi:MAG TPA: glutaredoxin domain-containing protein [Candidatus Cloacimonadota bacterium]|nr:glutaredoxin domain-containing protein [Candidatus Cloacimonadota bacterium]HPS38324.1 glutaredoxin domain-containing protein [Candidatus Cloacimonadota bacterium]